MIDLTAEREWVADILRDLDIASVYTYISGRTALPALRVNPGSPYLTSAQTFGRIRIHLSIVFVSSTGASDTETVDVDKALTQVINALLSHGISIDGSTGLVAVDTNNTSNLGAAIDISYEASTESKEN